MYSNPFAISNPRLGWVKGMPSPRNNNGASDTVRQKLSDLERTKTNILKLMEQDTPPNKVKPHPNMW